MDYGLSEIDVIYGESGFLISGIDYGTNSYETTDDTCHLATSVMDKLAKRSFTGCNTSQGAPVSQLSRISAGFPDGGHSRIGEPEGQATESENCFFKVNGLCSFIVCKNPVTANDSNVGIVSPSQRPSVLQTGILQRP